MVRVHCRVNKSPSLGSTLSQFTVGHVHTIYPVFPSFILFLHSYLYIVMRTIWPTHRIPFIWSVKQY